MLHQVGVSFDLYYDARKHKIKTPFTYLPLRDRSFNKEIRVSHHVTCNVSGTDQIETTNNF